MQDDAAGTEAHEGLVVGDRYRLVRRLGAGGFGRVWQAADQALGVEVAVKEVWLAPTMSPAERSERLVRAQREARSAARLRDHPNVVAVHDVLIENGAPWIVMQLVRGQSLADRLAAGEPLPPEQVARIAQAMLAALAAAHSAGVVHRDVKPANIMLTDDGRVLLTDFGIAFQTEDTSLTATGAFIGSVEYMAPERIQGQDNGGAGDLFSLGVALYQAVEGLSPFRRTTPTAALLAVICDPAPPPRRAGSLTPLIEGLMVKDPAQRLTVDAATALLGQAPPSATVRLGRPAVPTPPATAPATPAVPPAMAPAAPVVPPVAPAALPVAPSATPFVTQPVVPVKRRASRRAIAWAIGTAVVVCGATVAVVIALLPGGGAGALGLGSGGSSLASKLLQTSDMPAGFESDTGVGDMGYLRPADGSWPSSCSARNQETVWHRSNDNTVEYTSQTPNGDSYGESVQQVSADAAAKYVAAAEAVASCPSYTVDLVDSSGGGKQRCTVTTTALPAPTVTGATGEVVARRETYTCADVADATSYAPATVEKLTTSRGGYLVEFVLQPSENGSDSTLDPTSLLNKALAKLS